ncbi:hypothetical protein AVEN_175366-1 [Araneus ventricosus]|uniref:Uncharacterized protein n=1 Tax=Araneus ventricosus TaxID=182803 RepID=A0A4Y2RBT0_ARAVE|nr:hypothetical protein AVEN_175366-1 [Araneus ventricosus]
MSNKRYVAPPGSRFLYCNRQTAVGKQPPQLKEKDNPPLNCFLLFAQESFLFTECWNTTVRTATLLQAFSTTNLWKTTPQLKRKIASTVSLLFALQESFFVTATDRQAAGKQPPSVKENPPSTVFFCLSRVVFLYCNRQTAVEATSTVKENPPLNCFLLFAQESFRYCNQTDSC